MHPFLWLRGGLIENVKCEKARVIKENQHLDTLNTASKQHVEHHSSVRDNYSETKISQRAHFTRVTEVVELVQKCWIVINMQHVCNRYATNISMICIGHFSVEILGNVLFCYI